MTTAQVKWTQRPISEFPTIIKEQAVLAGKGVVNMTKAAKNWVVENKKVVLIALAIASIVAVAIGVGLFAAGAAAGLMTFTRTLTDQSTWRHFQFTDKSVLQLSSKALKGAGLAVAGILGYKAAMKALPQEQQAQ